MTTTIEELLRWMRYPAEDEHIEFKEAKTQFDSKKLVNYCVALGNEGGGRLVLGVSDKKPRKVVGTSAFYSLGKIRQFLYQKLQMRIEVEKLSHPRGRVVIFHIPSRPTGKALHNDGRYLMRAGGSLVPMTFDMLKRIAEEAEQDYSAEKCLSASFSDLHPEAIETLRSLWLRKSGNQQLKDLSKEQLLTDAELIVGDKITVAALVLLATRESLSKNLPQAEVVFEYRTKEATISHQVRKEYREGFFLFYEKLWELINLRNQVEHFRDGLFMVDIPTFNEAVVREAILNAVSHRDYRAAGSIFIRQFPRKMVIESPGGFPPGVTPENILWKQYPRNRRVAEVFNKCGLVERSGQGADRMFRESIREGKPRPDYSGTDDYQVSLELRGEIQNPKFLTFIEKVIKETHGSFTAEDFLALDMVYRDETIPQRLKERLPGLRDQGVLEITGRGRGTRYILSGRFYSYLGKKGAHTRKHGLDRETKKSLLVAHIKKYGGQGSTFSELWQVLPELTRGALKSILNDLKKEGRIHPVGKTKAARWFPGPPVNSGVGYVP
jgi:ATP-dependent DNA helicase RecG